MAFGITVVSLIFLQGTIHAQSQANPGLAENPSVPRYIVTLRDNEDPDSVVRAHGLSPRKEHVYRHAFKGFAAQLSPQMLARLRADPRVREIEPDCLIEKAQTVGTGLIRMGIPGYHAATGNSQSLDLDVAVIDSGIDLHHPALNVYQHIGLAGIASGSPGYDGDDWDGHGTHVAGIIGARDTAAAMVGVAPGVRLWSVQVIGPTAAQATWANFLAGMDYVAQHADQISVVNCSLNSTGGTPVVATQTAVRNVVKLGIVVVAAVANGNSQIIGRDRIWGTADDDYPAALPEVMAVSSIDPATDIFDSVSDYSSYARPGSFVISPGGAIDVAAPGDNIYSTWPGGTYHTLSGTSMAAAHVSGLVALHILAHDILPNGRAYSDTEVYKLRQGIVDSALPQANWKQDPNDGDNLPEPLAVVPILNFNSFMSSQGFRFSLTTWLGSVFSVQEANSPNSSTWTELRKVTGTGYAATVVDATSAPGSASSPSKRFYRVKNITPAHP